MPHKKYSSCYWEKQEQHSSYGGRQPSIACAGDTTAYTMRFNLTPGVYYTQPAAFPQACVSTFVCVLKHCVGHLNACTVFSCFLHPLRGGVYTQEVCYENLRIYRPQAQGPGLPRIRRAV